MIDPSHGLSISRQAKVLNISRGCVYYEPRPVPAGDLAIMRRIDELHLDYPFAGSRMLRDMLHREGIEIGRRHVATLMKRMGIEALYRRPNTSRPAPGHKIYPYLLRGLTVECPNQVWAKDITYIPMARGFVYLCAVVDWFSRRVLAWRLSITMEAAFCIDPPFYPCAGAKHIKATHNRDRLSLALPERGGGRRVRRAARLRSRLARRGSSNAGLASAAASGASDDDVLTAQESGVCRMVSVDAFDLFCQTIWRRRYGKDYTRRPGRNRLGLPLREYAGQRWLRHLQRRRRRN